MLQGQGFGGAGAGGFDGAGVLVAQCVEAGGGEGLLLALRFQSFSVSAFRFALVAGLFDPLFHSQPVEQRALGLLLAGRDFNQAPNEIESGHTPSLACL